MEGGGGGASGGGRRVWNSLSVPLGLSVFVFMSDEATLPFSPLPTAVTKMPAANQLQRAYMLIQRVWTAMFLQNG